MKRRYFLRGLGIGIIVTALVLCIFYRKQMSDMAIIHKAKELGMVFSESESASNAVSGTSVEPIVTVEPTTPPETAPPATQVPPEETVKPKGTTKPKQTGYYTFTIKKGWYSSTVASEMQKRGIIKEASKFDKYLVTNGYADRISVGKYKIPNNADFKEIAQIIAK